LFRGQWSNGMLPHMVFAPGRRDAGSRRLWQSKRCPDAPRDVETSCITQPPLPAIAAWCVSRELSAARRREFLNDVFGRLVAYHEWLYRERDLHGQGLVTLIHPWECGLDTTPPWMQQLRSMEVPRWVRSIEGLRLARVARALRRDTRFVPAAQRVSDDDGLRMLVLARRARRHGFELRRMPEASSVLVEDLAFNAFLIVANQALTSIAGELNRTLDALAPLFAKTESAIGALWDDETSQYYSRDATTGALIKSPTLATFLPLWTGVPSAARAQALIAQLRNADRYWTPFPVPSVPTDAPTFDVDRYWQGPAWVNTNWAIVQGLRRYDDTAAVDLQEQTIDMVTHGGFHEYFSPFDGTGFGADDFSWTAALTLDLLA
jgi:hypothetical protein